MALAALVAGPEALVARPAPSIAPPGALVAGAKALVVAVIAVSGAAIRKRSRWTMGVEIVRVVLWLAETSKEVPEHNTGLVSQIDSKTF